VSEWWANATDPERLQEIERTFDDVGDAGRGMVCNPYEQIRWLIGYAKEVERLREIQPQHVVIRVGDDRWTAAELAERHQELLAEVERLQGAQG